MLERVVVTVVTGMLRFYRFALSPLKPPCCRFSPTCSAYALEALHRFGILAGGWLAVRRLFKCHPFYRGEWWDPVPPAPPPPRKSSHG